MNNFKMIYLFFKMCFLFPCSLETGLPGQKPKANRPVCVPCSPMLVRCCPVGMCCMVPAKRCQNTGRGRCIMQTRDKMASSQVTANTAWVQGFTQTHLQCWQIRYHELISPG